MNFIDLRNASEDERYQVQGILSKESRNLEFTCGNKLKSKNLNGNQIEQNNKSDNSHQQAISNQKSTSSQSSSSSDQSLINSSNNISRNSSNGSLKMNGYHYNNNHHNYNNNYHNNFHNLDSGGDHKHSNSNHNLYNNHHNNHYNHPNQHHFHHNSHHHVHNSRMQPPVLQSYSTHPFIPGHLNNGTIVQSAADHPYKMPYYAPPQYTANSSKPFYPTNGPAHYPNTVLTSISPIATIAAPSITSNNNGPSIVTSNQMHSNCDQTNGQQSTNVTTATIENAHTASYSVTYPANANVANSFMHPPPPAQYIPAHPNAHHFTHQPMFYVPLHLPQFYPPTHPHYPSHHHLAPQPAILTAPHQQLATPPISPQQDNVETCSNPDNSSNCDMSDLVENDNQKEIALDCEEDNKDQTITPTNVISNYNFLSPESLEEKENAAEIKNKEENEEEIENHEFDNNKNTSSTNISSFSSVNELNTTNDEEQLNDEQCNEALNSNQNEQLFDESSEDKIDEEINDDCDQDNLIVESSINLNDVNDKKESDDLKNDEDKSEIIVKDEDEDSIATSNKSVPEPRSWADLFKSNQLNYNKPTKTAINNTSSANLFNTDDFEPLGQQQIESLVKFTSKLQQTIKSVSIEEDEAFSRLSKKLKDLNLKHSLPLLVPRGFTNQSNWCYINSILQALLYCPPFYNLMREIGETPGVFREKSATPVFDSFAKFFTNFMPNEQLMRKVKQSNHFGYDDLPKLAPYEPKCIYNVLGNINDECLKGKQEDAEEFLSSVLNILHEEMLLLLNYDPKNGQQQQQVSKAKEEQSHHSTKSLTGQKSADDDKSNSHDNGKLVWKEVKTKHKTLTANNCKIVDTPITDIFGGSMLIIRTAGKDVNHKSQPFFSLKLDIQSDKIRTVEDALRSLSSKESIHGYTCPRTNKIIEASSQTFLDQLPAILVLHLKLHHNGEDSQRIRKSQKKIDFSIDLEMPKECLTNVDRPKYSRNYKLLAVVHHDGKDAGKGHYFTDIYHIGTSLWLRCDDSKVDAISVQQLMKPQNLKIPYLLFYRRCDTLRVLSSKN